MKPGIAAARVRPGPPRVRPSHLLLFLLLLCLSALRAAPARPCGMSTHGEVCTRAAHLFASVEYPEYERIVRSHPEAYQAGAAFPDWGYAFGYPDESEEAHWPPFLDAMALYLREHCPRPWSAEDEQRVAFFLGVISHSVADMDWHGLAGVREGFIDVMSRQEFHGDWDAAHDVADTGGDFVESYEGDMSWLAPVWYVPLEDVAAVYRELGYEEVTAEVMLPRVLALYVGAAANRLGGRFLYREAAEPSPFLAGQFQDYAPGGLDSMALRTADWWGDYVRLIEEGILPEGAAAAWRGGPGPGGKSARGPPGAPAAAEAPIPGAPEGGVEAAATERGVLLAAQEPAPVPGGRGAPGEGPGGVSSPAPGLRVETDRPYSYLGTSVLSRDLDGDGLQELVVGAPGTSEPGFPQRGAVHVFNGRTLQGRSVLDASEADQTLAGPESGGRFGWALALADLNADGRWDLAVSSPATGAVDLELDGRVWVYLGREGDLPFSALPDVEIRAEETYARLGWSLGAGDANGDGFHDLLVGAPYAGAGGQQRGLVRLYAARAGLGSGSVWGAEDAAWQRSGEQDYDWFGSHVGVAPRPGGGVLVLVGAPGADPGGEQAAGRLYAYPAGGSASEGPLFTVDGEREFDALGAAFVAAGPEGDGSRVLALAAPTRSTEALAQAGEVFLVDLEALEGHLALADLQERRVLSGDRSFGRLGWRLAVGDVNRDGAPDLVATQPWRGDPVYPVRGAATVWRAGPDLPASGGVPSDPQEAERILGTVDRARLGDAAWMGDLNGDGLDDLLLGAGRASGRARYAGALFVYFTPACEDRDEDGYGGGNVLSCPRLEPDCVDDPSDDPEACSGCACGTEPCASCARCVHPGAREFPGDETDSNCNGDADCFVAQAAFGSALAGKTHVLRALRDRVLLRSAWGAALVDAYYAHGPVLARWVRESGLLRRAVRVLLLPLVGLAHVLL